MAYSEVYLITLYIWGTSSFLDSALGQRTGVKKESIFKHDLAAAWEQAQKCRGQGLQVSPNNILGTQSHTKNN